MTVKEIFEMRKEGRIEEAYAAIRPMYAAHKGKYTSICMFWTASDIFKLRLEQGKTDEARQILQALRRMLPYVEDKDGKAIAFIQYATRRLSKVTTSQRTPILKDNEGIRNTPVQKEEEISDIREIRVQKEEAIRELDNNEGTIEEDLSGYLVVGLDEGINRPSEGINNSQQRVLEYIRAHEGCNVPKIVIALTIPAKSVERHIAALIAKQLIEHRGSKKTGGYYIHLPWEPQSRSAVSRSSPQAGFTLETDWLPDHNVSF